MNGNLSKDGIAKDKITFATIATYRADAPLRASGLLGPVSVLRVSGK